MKIQDHPGSKEKTDPPRSDQAYTALRRDILMGTLEPDSKLKLDELQRKYGLSSSPLREALNRLVAEHIVTSDERRGFRAAPVSLDDLNDVTRFRLIAEVEAFDQSIVNGDTEWEAGMMVALHRLQAFEQVACPRDRLVDYTGTELHRTFHMSLIGACGSRLLIDACGAKFDYAQRYRRIWAHKRPAPRNAGPEHKRLVEAAMRRDRAGARELLRQHIQKTADHVSRFLT